MLGLAIFGLLGIITTITDLKQFSWGKLILTVVWTAAFGFFAWRFKDERVAVAAPEELETKGDPTKKLERLVKMHKDGVITDAEFQEKKEKLMRLI